MNAVVHQNQRYNREEVFTMVSQTIPHNDFGLPKFFYRCDLIPDDFYELDDHDQKELLQASRIEISYQEGYPTFKSTGNPLWGQMDNECDEDGVLFKAYLDQLQTKGYRQLQSLTKDPSVNCPKIEYVQSLFNNYYWSQRAKAHDLFIAAAHRRMRDIRVMSCETYALRKTDELLGLMDSQLQHIFSDEALQAMTPQDAIKVYKDLILMQQKVLKNAEGKGKDDNGSPHASMEVTLRQVAQGSGAIISATSDEADTNGGNILQILNDPATAGMAQELIVRMDLGGRKARAPNGDQVVDAQLSPDINFTKDAQGRAISSRDRNHKGDEKFLPAGSAETRADPIEDIVPIDDLDREMMS